MKPGLMRNTHRYIFEILSNQTEIRLYLLFSVRFGTTNGQCPFADPNISENGMYILISVWFDKISKRFLCVQRRLEKQSRSATKMSERLAYFGSPWNPWRPSELYHIEGFEEGCYLGPHDAERRQSCGQQMYFYPVAFYLFISFWIKYKPWLFRT